jgi:hypothetical protein
MTLQRPEDYVFDLDREVAEFYREHPDKKMKVFFIDVSKTPAKLIWDDPGREAVIDMLKQDESLGDTIAEMARKSSHSLHYQNADTGEVFYSIILMNTPNDIRSSPLGYGSTPDLNAVFAFDHEAGHTVCTGGQKKDIAESVGDAYAIIRHFQRFKNSIALKNLAAVRAVELLRDDGFHFTSPVIEAVLTAKKTGFRRLSKQETSDLASTFARAAAPKPEYALNFIAKTSAVGSEHSVLIQDIANCILHDMTPEEFKWGSVALRALLQGDIVWNGQRFTPNDPVWAKETLKQLNNRSRSAPSHP